MQGFCNQAFVPGNSSVFLFLKELLPLLFPDQLVQISLPFRGMTIFVLSVTPAGTGLVAPNSEGLPPRKFHRFRHNKFLRSLPGSTFGHFCRLIPSNE